MPNTTKTTMNGRTLCFEEESHTYTDDRNMQYDSVTTMLGHYGEKFDADAIAQRMEDQGKGKKEELKKEWEKNRDEACRFGTRVHEVAEDCLLGNAPRHKPESEKERIAMKAVWDYCKGEILPCYEIIKPELMVFHPEWHIAGTIDLPVRMDDGTVVILDFKTNTKIDREGFGGRTMKHPVGHLQDCAFSKYCLQLNIYQQILVHGKYVPPSTPFRRALLYVPPMEDRVEWIEVPEMKYEAMAVILDWVFARVPF